MQNIDVRFVFCLNVMKLKLSANAPLCRVQLICLFIITLPICSYSQTKPAEPLPQSAVQEFDNSIMRSLAKSRTPGQTEIMLGLTHSIHYGDVGVPAALLLGGFIANNQQMRQNSLYVASSTALSYALTLVIKHFVKRPRPFVRDTTFVAVYKAGSTSFPSGHTSTSFATVTALSIAYPKWYVIAPAYLWAGSVSYSRMYLGEHFPSDVAAGLAIGVGSAITLSSMKH